MSIDTLIADLEEVLPKATPGPWFVTPDDEWTMDSARHVQWGQYLISAGSANGEDEHYYRIAAVSNISGSDENEANAELIHLCSPDNIAALLAEVKRLREDAKNLRTVMIAAAEEIHAHWPAHCDADGYGPANLMRRLECGIPSEYGYTAGAFADLKADADRYRWLRACLWNQEPNGFTGERSWLWSTRFASGHQQSGDLDFVTQGQELDAAIDERLAEEDAARKHPGTAEQGEA